MILGGGESGVGAAILARKQGYQVFLSDSQSILMHYQQVLKDYQIVYEEKGHTEEKILTAELIIKSPGIPEKSSLIQRIRERAIPVVSEIEFASWYTSAKIIAITGSNGKTTTSMLTYHLLKESGLSVGLAGNVGDSFAWQVAEKSFDYYVLEISSFQLDDIDRFKPNISVILNITPDHLDRYDYDFQKYVNSKFLITKNQTEEDAFIYFADSMVLLTEFAKRKLPVRAIPVSLASQPPIGGYLADDILVSQLPEGEFIEPFPNLPIQGPHNAVNALIAITIAQLLGVESQRIRSSLATFVNAPHRLEPVGNIQGVSFVNDSKATNVDSVYYALGSYTQPIILIAGGVDKGNDYSQIEDLVRQKVKGLIILTPDSQKLETYFEGIVPQIFVTQKVEEAVQTAAKWAESGDVVLLSPACASFDLFKNYQDRGEKFKQAVKEYAHEMGVSL